MAYLRLYNYRYILILLLAATFVTAWVDRSVAFDEINTTFFGVAIKGYDPVAYHTENRAVKGKSTFTHNWNDAKWYFASAANRNLFVSNPERYAPQYGGY